jgi:AraC-like DNA-binding protein
MQLLVGGGYSIKDSFEINGSGASWFVFGRGWLLEVVELERGEYYFEADGKEVRSGRRRLGAFYPRFTIVRPVVKNARGEVRGVGDVKVPDGLPDRPFVFETDFDGEFTSTGEALEVIAGGKNRQSIEVNPQPSLLTVRAKKLIDENFFVFPSIAKIAERLGVSHAHMSRQFKRDLGLSPSEYLHHLRVAEATFRLSLGEEIIDISHEVGYNDLSRFYKQFKKTTDTSPAACRSILDSAD